MKRANLILVAALLHGPAWAADKVELVGHYDSIVMSDTDDPHYESGYRLDLYRQGGRVFGHIDVANGSIDLCSADLRDVAFDAATKRLSFRATYAGGWEYGPGIGPKGREARIALTFSGTVGRRAVVGQMESRDAYLSLIHI